MQYLTTRDAMTVLRITRQRLNMLLHAGRVPGAMRIGSNARAPWLIPSGITRIKCGLPVK